MTKINLVMPIRTSINVGSELNCHQTKQILLESMYPCRVLNTSGVVVYLITVTTP